MASFARYEHRLGRGGRDVVGRGVRGAGAIPWLKLRVTGAQYGPDYGRKIASTTFIQRVNTAGGVAPATGCTNADDIGRRVFVPYTTDYVFYR